MDPAKKLIEITKPLVMWASFHQQWKVDFNSYALQSTEGVVFIDPLQPTPAVIKKLEKLGEPIAIVLTDANHARGADWFRKRYDIQIYAHEQAEHDAEVKLDVLVLDGEKLPGSLRALYLPGSTDSDMALYAKLSGGIVFVGDALLNLPGQGLTLLPEPYIGDRKQALQSLRRLLDLNFKVVTFAHGQPLVDDAKKKIAAFCKRPK